MERHLALVALRRKLVALALIALTALGLLWQSKEIPLADQAERIGPAFWPALALVGVLLGVGIRCVELLLRHRSGRSDAAFEHAEGMDLRRAFIAIAVCITAVALIEFAGFVIANFLFLLAFLQITGLKSKANCLLIAAGGTVVMVYIFVKLVYVPLPRGSGFFEDATIMLYRLLGIF